MAKAKGTTIYPWIMKKGVSLDGRGLSICEKIDY
jgi:hypothetical protein